MKQCTSCSLTISSICRASLGRAVLKSLRLCLIHCCHAWDLPESGPSRLYASLASVLDFISAKEQKASTVMLQQQADCMVPTVKLHDASRCLTVDCSRPTLQVLTIMAATY